MDNLVLFSRNIQEITKILKEQAEAALEFGFEMNTSMTNILSYSENDVYLQNNKLENVAEYIFLGNMIRLFKENQVAVPNRVPNFQEQRYRYEPKEESLWHLCIASCNIWPGKNDPNKNIYEHHE